MDFPNGQNCTDYLAFVSLHRHTDEATVVRLSYSWPHKPLWEDADPDKPEELEGCCPGTFVKQPLELLHLL